MHKTIINISKHCCLVFFLFFSLLLLPFCAAAAPQHKIVRVGWYDDIYNITGAHGERSGYGYEYQQTIAAYTGWKYEYVTADWLSLFEMLQKGEIDMLDGISYTDERAQHMLFSELPMGWEKYYLYADIAHTDISADNLKSLNGKRVGVLLGSVQVPMLLEWEKRHNLQLEHIPVSGFEDTNNKFAKREIDCVTSTGSLAWEKEGIAALANTGTSAIYFVINKNRPDLKEELDKAMRKIEADQPFYTTELNKRYLSSTSSAVLSNEEQAWLKKHGPIRIGYLQDDLNVSSLDKETGKLTGVIKEYVKFVQDALGKQNLHFELTSFPTQKEQMQALKENRIDMIFHFNQNHYMAEQNDFILSNTVLSFNLAAVTAKNYFNENQPHTVAITKDNLNAKWHLTFNYPNWKIMEYESMAAVEKAVRNQQADCFVIRSGKLTAYANDKQLHPVFLTRQSTTAFAVNRENILLLAILNKTLKSMPSTMLSSALSMYNNTPKTTLLDFIKDNQLAVAMFIIVLMLLLEILRRSRIAEAKATQTAEQFAALNQELEESHQKLQVALARAENANTAKSNFLFNMSHDIRTPMNAILGYTELMKPKLKDPELLQYQQKMEQSGKLLLSIINNVLDMARIESGKFKLDENYSNVNTMLQEIYEVFEIDAKKKGITLKAKAQLEHQHIMCDATKVHEIFANLISNAIKYTPSCGHINIELEELPSAKQGYIRLRTVVSDDGIGMDKDYLPTLFEAFSREYNTTMGKVPGTGLGMAIVKKLVEMMGGSIEVASELGKGSSFTVILEHKIAEKEYYDQKAAAQDVSINKDVIKGKHILLAEDNDLNAEIAMVILNRMGLVVERVEDGVQCVNKLDKQPAGTYDLILMDIQMPNMDGYKATQAIRNFADQRKASIPIIAMTANAFEEDKRNALKAGMNDHIAKPIDVDKIEKILVALLK